MNASGIFQGLVPQAACPRRVHDFFEGGESDGGSPYDTPLTSFRRRMLAESIPVETSSPPSENTGMATPSDDRLVPDRQGLAEGIGVALYHSNGKAAKTGLQPPYQRSSCDSGPQEGESYRVRLACSLFGAQPCDVSDRILRFGAGQPLHPLNAEEHDRNLRVIYSRNKTRQFRSKHFRYIPQTPERILDGPELVDDYYLNLLDWSQSNVLSVALKQTVYLWNAESGDITQLTHTGGERNIVTGLSFAKDTPTLAIGTNNADVELWDVASGAKMSTLKGHIARVVSLAWNGHLLASGSRDSSINLHDTRAAGGPVGTLTGHEQEVCGLQWSLDGTQLASGGNDNLLHVWDNRHRHEPRLRLTSHTAAVKAIGWSPHQGGLLATGGGTADRTLRFWNTSSGECIHTIDTKSQVCSLLWSVNRNELLTSHGYSENQLSLWKYPSMKRIANLTGHSSRVLHLALSPDGQTVVSAAGDETIRFWKCFAEEKSKRRRAVKPTALLSPLTLR
eukprot:TRINITY_DN36051_c0_g1_i1.p1 TRINITY_DN36051_c0_g1~~TRINITY_DN36051_c0_g1_i1.p1  ORF type:complete len:522 (+),score=127.62 TRINITY_DN36051_c0_g1_i1:51-1568(+)